MNSLRKIFNFTLLASLMLAVACGDDEDVTEGNPPEAFAGMDVEVGTGAEVTLDGSGSFDPDGDELIFNWSFDEIPDGSNATIARSNESIASFIADVEGVYVITLNVNDGSFVDTDQIIVTVLGSVGSAPEAVIQDQFGAFISDENENNIVGVDAPITLSGIASTDPDFDALTYEWSVVASPDGSTSTLNPVNEVITTFESTDLGNYSIQLKVDDGNGNQDSTSVIIKVEPLPKELSEDITTNTSLVDVYDDPTLADYRVVKSRIFVEADLEIDPGVVIEFEQDNGLYITTSGSLLAVGLADDSITFRGVEQTTGYWAGLGIQSNSSDNQLEYVVVSDAGSSGFDGANILSNVTVEDDGLIAINNSTISNGAGAGVYVRSLSSEISSFMNNEISGNEVSAASMINHFQYFDKSTNYSGNENDYIRGINGSETSEDVLWQNINVPYFLYEEISYIATHIEIEAGADFLASSDAGIFVEPSGALTAIGTASDIITFKGEEDLEGVWRGIGIESNNTNNKIQYVEISNGGQRGFDGANIQSNLIVQGSGRVEIVNSTFTKSEGSGLYVRSEEVNLPNFSTNVFTGNQNPVAMMFNNWHFLDSQSDYIGNEKNYILGISSNIDLDETVSWNKLNVPYRIPDRIEVIGNGGVTIAAGVEIIAASDGGLQVSSDGFLTINGTASDPVFMKGEQEVSGYWRGIQVQSNNANNHFNYLDIGFGGSRGFDGGNRKANIEIRGENSRLILENSDIHDSAGYGVRYDANTTFQASGNIYSDNDLGDTGEN